MGKNPLALLAAVIALAAPSLTIASAPQDWAKSRLSSSSRHQEWVENKSGSRTLKSFVVYPEIKERATVIVLIHEIMGLTDWIMLLADQLAGEGYIVVAPDFLSGMGPDGGRTIDFADVGKARESVSGLPPAQVTSDLDTAVAYGAKIPASNGKVVVAGFCWGGTQAFNYATASEKIAASFVFYGGGPTDPSSIAKIKCPVYGFYGGNDNRVNATIPVSEKLMQEAGNKYDPVLYDGAGHGFMRSGDQPDAQEVNKKGRDVAWSRWLSLLKSI